jgi:DNA-binding winged helix-turn-helix (wHTH) protein
MAGNRPADLVYFIAGTMQLRFGPCVLDTERRQLLRDGDVRHLSPKGFELLRLLADNRPRVLSKAELHERLWPSVFVSEATLSSLVAEVRAALGENAQSGGFIRTVHRYGYAFQGEGAEVTPAPPDATAGRCWVIWEFGQVALGEGRHLLGRDADVAVWLESPTISRHHAAISVSPEGATIVDLGSKNGTHLRGQRLDAPAALGDGDEIRLGSVVVRFRMPAATGSTATKTSSS